MANVRYLTLMELETCMYLGHRHDKRVISEYHSWIFTSLISFILTS
jgi:hypothetical protein